jgi:hypothetical protein
MARRDRPQASRGSRHGRAGRRAAPAEKKKPETNPYYRRKTIA